MSEEYAKDVAMTRVRRYLRQAEILRQIHSDKAFRAERAGRWYTIITVLAAALLSLLSFAGPERLTAAFIPGIPVTAANIQVLLNWSVLVTVALALLGLIYRFDERSAQHHHSIERLTEFIRDCEDLVALAAADGKHAIRPEGLTAIRERYKGVAATLPPSTDREYKKSKKRYNEKKNQPLLSRGRGTSAASVVTYTHSEKARGSKKGWFWKKFRATRLSEAGAIDVLNDAPDAHRSGRRSRHTNSHTFIGGRGAASVVHVEPRRPREAALAERLTVLVRTNERNSIMRIVRTELGERFWLIGGFVRDPVWDALEDHSIATPLDDIDVIYYDEGVPRDYDKVLLQRLRQASPNQNWSVVNEAHAHLRSGDEAYGSLEGAICRFPETASTVAVRLDANDELHVYAPLGMSDLFKGLVRPSPLASREQYKKRLKKKNWTSKWPEVKVKDI